MKFQSIKQFPKCNYKANVPFLSLEDNLEHYGKTGLELNPHGEGETWNNANRHLTKDVLKKLKPWIKEISNE